MVHGWMMRRNGPIAVWAVLALVVPAPVGAVSAARIDQQIPVVKSFDSQGSGDAQYELWCETHDWFDTERER